MAMQPSILRTVPHLHTQVKFQHEVYPQADPDTASALSEQLVSRQVFIVQDLEIRDRLATSQMNKFLHLYSSKEMPRKAHSNMVRCSSYFVRLQGTWLPFLSCRTPNHYFVWDWQFVPKCQILHFY